MQWIAPSEEDTANGNLETRLWADRSKWKAAPPSPPREERAGERRPDRSSTILFIDARHTIAKNVAEILKT
jgi:hypothetical protein